MLNDIVMFLSGPFMVISPWFARGHIPLVTRARVSAANLLFWIGGTMSRAIGLTLVGVTAVLLGWGAVPTAAAVLLALPVGLALVYVGSKVNDPVMQALAEAYVE